MSKLWTLVVVAVCACSVYNREGLELSCKQLGNGSKNACRDGIITSCVDDEVRYRVCDLEDACEEAWQEKDAYRCSQDETLELKASVSGTQGSEVTYEACGGKFETRECASCVEATCCALATECLEDEECSSCVNRPASSSQCVPGLVPLFDQFRECTQDCECQ